MDVKTAESYPKYLPKPAEYIAIYSTDWNIFCSNQEETLRQN